MWFSWRKTSIQVEIRTPPDDEDAHRANQPGEAGRNYRAHGDLAVGSASVFPGHEFFPTHSLATKRVRGWLEKLYKRLYKTVTTTPYNTLFAHQPPRTTNNLRTIGRL